MKNKQRAIVTLEIPLDPDCPLGDGKKLTHKNAKEAIKDWVYLNSTRFIDETDINIRSIDIEIEI